MTVLSSVVALGCSTSTDVQHTIHTVERSCNTHMLTVFRTSIRASGGASKL